MKPFPWNDAMEFGFGVLRLSPDAFWQLTPRELAHAIRAVHGHVPASLGRSDLRDLMQRFPDKALQENPDE